MHDRNGMVNVLYYGSLIDCRLIAMVWLIDSNLAKWSVYVYYKLCRLVKNYPQLCSTHVTTARYIIICIIHVGLLLLVNSSEVIQWNFLTFVAVARYPKAMCGWKEITLSVPTILDPLDPSHML